MAESHHLSITKGQSTPRAKAGDTTTAMPARFAEIFSLCHVMVKCSQQLHTEEELIAVVVKPVMSSTRGLKFLLVCNYCTNFVRDHQGFTSGLRDCTPTPLEGSHGGTFHRGIIITPYSRLNLCYTHTESSLTASLRGFICGWFQIPALGLIDGAFWWINITVSNLKGGYLGSYRRQGSKLNPHCSHSHQVIITAASHLCACLLFPSSI